jgi:hypothetical protein
VTFLRRSQMKNSANIIPPFLTICWGCSCRRNARWRIPGGWWQSALICTGFIYLVKFKPGAPMMLHAPLQVAPWFVIRAWRQGGWLATSNNHQNNNLPWSMGFVYGPFRNYFEIFDKFFKTYGKPICNVNHEVRHFAILHEQKSSIVWLP